MSWEVYVIQESGEGPVKIGCAWSTASRLKTLQTGNPRELRIVFAVDVGKHSAPLVESALHRRCSHLRIRGEWFTADAIEIARDYLAHRSRWPKPKPKQKDSKAGLPWSPEDFDRAIRMLLSHPVLSKEYPTDEMIAAHVCYPVNFVSIIRQVWESQGRPMPRGCEDWRQE